ncbi:hypothetical protein Aduo_010257 [Ancylostoma duodenale]
MKTSGTAAKQSPAGAKSAASPAKKQEPGEGGARSNVKDRAESVIKKYDRAESVIKKYDVAKLMPTQYESEKKPKGLEKKETPHHTPEKRSKEEKGKAPAKPGETMEEASVVKQPDAIKPSETPASTAGDQRRPKKLLRTLLRYKRTSYK